MEVFDFLFVDLVLADLAWVDSVGLDVAVAAAVRCLFEPAGWAIVPRGLGIHCDPGGLFRIGITCLAGR